MKKANYLIAFLISAATSSAFAGVYSDTTINDSFAAAKNLTTYFSNGFNADVGDSTGANTSLAAPWVTVQGKGNGAYDYFSFTTESAGRVIVDIDYTQSHPSNSNGFDAYLRLFDSSFVQLGANDDYSSRAGAGGSVHGYDSFLQFANLAAGTYFVQVGVCCSNAIPTARNYTLQLQAQVAPVPEPETYALMGMGLAGLLAARRRKFVK